MAKIIKATITSSSVMPCWRLIFRVIATNVRRFKYEVTGRLQSPQAPPLRQRYAERRGFAPDTATPAAAAPPRHQRDGLPFNAQPQRDAVRRAYASRLACPAAATLRQPPLPNATP